MTSWDVCSNLEKKKKENEKKKGRGGEKGLPHTFRRKWVKVSVQSENLDTFMDRDTEETALANATFMGEQTVEFTSDRPALQHKLTQTLPP